VNRIQMNPKFIPTSPPARNFGNTIFGLIHYDQATMNILIFSL